MGMKTMLVWMLALGFISSLNAQDHPVNQKIHREVLLKYPELNNKEIFLSVSPPSEENKAQWQKTQSTFAYAKLKGGRSGFQIVLLFIDGKVQDEITLRNKYEALGFKILPLSEESFQKIQSVRNLILDHEGKMMESGIEENNLFNRILNHITR
jgi:hypothetical protein